MERRESQEWTEMKMLCLDDAPAADEDDAPAADKDGAVPMDVDDEAPIDVSGVAPAPPSSKCALCTEYDM